MDQEIIDTLNNIEFGVNMLCIAAAFIIMLFIRGNANEK